MENSKKTYWESHHQGISKRAKHTLNEYLLSLKTEKKAEATITKYRQVLERFFVECTVPIEELTSDDVGKWINESSVYKKPKTMDMVLAVLSSFFNFCLEEEYIKKMMMKKRWRPKIPHTLPKYLDEFEYARIRRVAEKLSVRDRALILFLFTSGCRRSEVSNLNIQDIDLKKRTAIVIGKGNKIRHVHFSEECALVLNDYLQTRICDEMEPLFTNKFGRRLQPGGIYEVVAKLGRKAGLKRTLHPHICRHTFATNMLARGAALQFIADEMGQSDLNTTRIYAKIPTEELILKYQNIMG